MTAAVMVNYRTPELSIAAVRALEEADSAPDRVIVVDNGSADDSAPAIRRELPGAELLLASANGGFAAGCNLGIREALRQGATRVLLLNPDVLVERGAVSALERALDAHPGLGIAGPMLVSRAVPERVESLGIRYSSVTGRMRHDGVGAAPHSVAPFGVRDVDGVSGCAMLVARGVFERIGLLAEPYFYGFEDLDFCLRARAAGFRTACVGDARVWHAGQASIGRASGRRIYFATRNHLLLTARLSAPRRRGVRWLQQTAVLGFNVAHVLFTSDVNRMTGLAAFAQGAWDHAVGRYGAGSFQEA